MGAAGCHDAAPGTICTSNLNLCLAAPTCAQVYEERRRDSLRILDETHSRRQQIEEVEGGHWFGENAVDWGTRVLNVMWRWGRGVRLGKAGS